MKRVTRDVEPMHNKDLLERVPRACIAFAGEQGLQAEPVALIWKDDRYLIGIPGHVSQMPQIEQEVVLLVDDGTHFFDLRAIYVRGHVQTAEVTSEMPADYRWYKVVPVKTVAWDYGMLREVKDEH